VVLDELLAQHVVGRVQVLEADLLILSGVAVQCGEDPLDRFVCAARRCSA